MCGLKQLPLMVVKQWVIIEVPIGTEIIIQFIFEKSCVHISISWYSEITYQVEKVRDVIFEQPSKLSE